YDRSVPHLLRATWTGSIRASIATLPPDQVRFGFRDRGGEGRMVTVPFASKSYWAVSADGARIAIVAPEAVGPDSSAPVRLTMLGDKGDTIFSRRYSVGSVRTDTAAVSRFLSNLRPVGEISASQIRDSVAKHIPAFQSLVTGIVLGSDRSAWILFR